MGIFPCANLKCWKVNLVATKELIKIKKSLWSLSQKAKSLLFVIVITKLVYVW